VQPDIDFIDIAGRRIAHRLRRGVAPTLVFLPGYASDMEGAKALALDAFAERRGMGLLRLDYSGTGSSGGAFADGTLSLWIEETIAVVVGSSMGGWIALHLALLRPDRVRALVAIAVATDFTAWGFGDGDSAERQGIGRAFWESGQQLLLLDNEIAIDCAVRLLHGENDKDVPLDIAFRTMRALRSADVQLNVVKGAGHRLSEPHEIDAILRTVRELLEPAP